MKICHFVSRYIQLSINSQYLLNMKKLVALLLFISLCSPAWAAVGSVFSVGDLKYVVANEPASSSSYGRVTCSGLSDAGKAKSSLSLTIPYNVSYGGSNYLCTTVGANAFYNCSNIANVRLTYGIKDVAASAFQGCTNLTYVRLPSSINYLREKCFYGCNNLSNVYYAGMADDIITNGNAFSPRSSRTLWVPGVPTIPPCGGARLSRQPTSPRSKTRAVPGTIVW